MGLHGVSSYSSVDICYNKIGQFLGEIYLKNFYVVVIIDEFKNIVVIIRVNGDIV